MSAPGCSIQSLHARAFFQLHIHLTPPNLLSYERFRLFFLSSILFLSRERHLGQPRGEEGREGHGPRRRRRRETTRLRVERRQESGEGAGQEL